MPDVNPLPWYKDPKFGYFVMTVIAAVIGYFTGSNVNPPQKVEKLELHVAAPSTACTCK